MVGGNASPSINGKTNEESINDTYTVLKEWQDEHEKTVRSSVATTNNQPEERIH